MIFGILKNKSILFLVGFVFFGIYLYIYSIPSNSINPIVKIEPQYAADFSDDRILMGASHNVFIGKVFQKIGAKERGVGPETQFQVEVIDNIKGELKGTVTVNQEGGYKDGVLYIVGDEGDTMSPEKESSYLLQSGSTYLFATRYNPEENWYTLNSYPTANKLLSKDNLNEVQLKTLIQNDSRVQELKSVYPTEVLIDADVKSSNTLNSYKSIQKKFEEENKPEVTPIVSADSIISTHE